MDKTHPAHSSLSKDIPDDVILSSYKEADRITGDILSHLDKDDLLIVLSDHGFVTFRRCVDLNKWLLDNGYLFIKEGEEHEEYLQGIDWEKTLVYAFGLAGIYINLHGREGKGIVKQEDYDGLRKGLKAVLRLLLMKKKGKMQSGKRYS